MTSFQRGCVLAVMLLAMPALAAAQSIDTFSFQGRLTDADGTPVADGSYAVDFSLHDQTTSGNRIWRETQTVTTTDGVFTVQLGSATPFGALAFDQPYFLSLTVEGEAMAPRTPLSATPYAMRAHRLDGSALQGGSNITISENSNGTLRISSSGSGGGLRVSRRMLRSTATARRATRWGWQAMRSRPDRTSLFLRMGPGALPSAAPAAKGLQQ